jgi:hypothetical protein
MRSRDSEIAVAQMVDLHHRDRATGEFDDEPAALAQRAERVGEPVTTNRVDHHVHTPPVGETADVVEPRPVRPHHRVGAAPAGDLFIPVAGDEGDRLTPNRYPPSIGRVEQSCHHPGSDPDRFREGTVSNPQLSGEQLVDSVRLQHGHWQPRRSRRHETASPVMEKSTVRHCGVVTERPVCPSHPTHRIPNLGTPHGLDGFPMPGRRSFFLKARRRSTLLPVPLPFALGGNDGSNLAMAVGAQTLGLGSALPPHSDEASVVASLARASCCRIPHH